MPATSGSFFCSKSASTSDGSGLRRRALPRSKCTVSSLHGPRRKAEIVYVIHVLTGVHARSEQGLLQRHPDDFGVEREAPVVDVPNIEQETFAERDRLATVDLRPTRDPGLHLM